ncbi:transcription factor HES-5-like [Bombina bombina]|uniref:transcription factor HES-5-like n=1 Tax=Bombina bombina TaxID=8345 RepID=UPI00235ABA91|nr:transcription factor HES-5-like [Bombina bombina]
MAPNTAILDLTKMAPKQKHKLRKPAVEKMRRDRINSSIEQLKVLLEKEFHQQQPNVKLEKADILEMTVTYLKQKIMSETKNVIQHGQLQMELTEGYSKCFENVLDFLSLHQKQHGAESKLINHFQSSVAFPNPLPSPIRLCQSKQAVVNNNGMVWRPW